MNVQNADKFPGEIRSKSVRSGYWEMICVRYRKYFKRLSTINIPVLILRILNYHII